MHRDRESLATGDGERVLLGCAPDMSLDRLQAFLGALYSSHPELHTEVVHLPSAEQLRRLELGALDLALVHDPGPQPLVEFEAACPGEPLVAYVSIAHPLAGREALGPDELRDELRVTFPRRAEPALSDRLTAVLEEAGVQFRSVHETAGADPRDVLLAVADLRGVTIGARSLLAVAGELDSIVTSCRLEPALRMPDTMLAWRSRAKGEDGIVAAARDAARRLRCSFDA